MSPFSDLGLAEPLVRAVTELGYTEPTPIQQQAIPHVLEQRDLLASAQTGTGKTAAFGLPLLQLLAEPRRRPVAGRPRALILTPTRELAIQIDENLRGYAANLPLRHGCIFGGVSQRPQVEALKRGLDILTATPGRLLDLQGQGHVDFDHVERFVLDEADRMLDMGFLPDVRRVLARLPSERHSLFFSATMPPDIVSLSSEILTDPVHVEIVPESTTAEGVTQRVLFVGRDGKKELVVEVVQDERVERALVFTRTKHRANRVVKLLDRHEIRAAAIHGNKSQNARQRALAGFRTGDIPVLVATDIAARGIDVEGITHVINFDVPNEPEAYVHRIGRTARAGARGMALTFCDHEEVEYLRAIENLIGERVKVAGDRIGMPPEVLDPGPVGSRRRTAQSKGGSKGGKPGGGGRKRSSRRRRNRGSQPRSD